MPLSRGTPLELHPTTSGECLACQAMPVLGRLGKCMLKDKGPVTKPPVTDGPFFLLVIFEMSSDTHTNPGHLIYIYIGD